VALCNVLCYLNFSWDLDSSDEDIDLEREDMDEEIEFVPMYFHPKLEELSKEQYFRDVLSEPHVHKAALKECVRGVKKMKISKELVPQRMPFG